MFKERNILFTDLTVNALLFIIFESQWPLGGILNHCYVTICWNNQEMFANKT